MPVKIRCLLLVDDDPAEVLETTSKLERTQLELGELLVANSLAQAITHIVNKEVDIILLDLDLGDSKSVDTIVAVRGVTDAVLIVLSANDDEVLGVESLRNGADEFLVKDDMTDDCFRRAIIRSITRRKVRSTAARITAKLGQLDQMSGVVA